jgi:hypothetical protein
LSLLLASFPLPSCLPLFLFFREIYCAVFYSSSEFLQVVHAERRQVDQFTLLVFGVGACSLTDPCPLATALLSSCFPSARAGLAESSFDFRSAV